jgi:asparaginyl-tRNA synthetase
MLEAEVAFMDSAGNMELQEQMISTLVADVLSHCGADLTVLERDTAPLEKVVPPFPRVDYAEAVERLQKAGSSTSWGDDLGGEDETILTRQFDKPIFVTNYPRKAKAFYMKENPADPRTVLCSDLLAPEGYGEIIGGSQREDDLGKLLARIREENLPEAAYAWYLDLRKYGSVPHSGFGLGLERAVTWIAGLEHVREANPFPRTMTRLYP